MLDLWPACQRMIDVLAGITDDKLAGATPCAEYTVAGLPGHVDTLSIRLAALARGEDAGPAGDSPRELIGQHVHALAAAWQEPSAWQGTTDLGVTLTSEVWGRIALTEMVVHGWDLATAPDQPLTCPNPPCARAGSTCPSSCRTCRPRSGPPGVQRCPCRRTRPCRTASSG